MNTENTRVTREEAAELAGVSLRQIRRWRESGQLVPEYGPIGARVPATYDRNDVLALALRETRDVPLPAD